MTFDPIAPSDAPRRKPATPRAMTRLLRCFGLARPRADLDEMARRILLPSLPISDEEHARTRLYDAGRALVRQEDWALLAERITEADAKRLHTPGGKAAAELLAEGARADVLAAAADAIGDGRAPDPAGLDALEQVCRDHPRAYPIALVVAHAHVDIGHLWRVCGAKGVAAPEREARFLDHFRRATDLLVPFGAATCDAPSLAAAQCALLPACPTPGRRAADDHARLIALDPDCPCYLRATGAALRPGRFGSLAEIESAARDATERPGAWHGSAAYAWIWFDALALCPDGLATVDTGRFIEGMRAIAGRKPDQHIINEFAAFCGIAMAPRDGSARLPATGERTRAAIHACLDWLVAEHLAELHPVVWAQALDRPAPGQALPPRRMLMARGREAALRAIAARFADELADGCALGFSRAGMYRLPPI